MLIKQNKKFDKLISHSLKKVDDLALNQKLEEFLGFGFKEVDDCIYFNELAPEGNKYSSEHQDRTGNEMFYNKFQIDDFVDSKTREEQVVMARCFVNRLAADLVKKYGYPFKVILSCDAEYCNISFHKVRKDEKYLLENLEEYTMDSIYTITTLFNEGMNLDNK